MNTQEFISSGILEMYVLGAVSEAEQQQVVQMAAQHDDVREALEQCYLDIESYVSLYAKAPPAAMFTRISSAIENKTPVIPIQSSPDKPAARSGMRYAMAASLLLFLISMAFNIYLFLNNRQDKKELVAKQELLQKDLDSTTKVVADITAKATSENLALVEKHKKAMDFLTTLHNPSIIKMNAVKTDMPAATNALVYWCSVTHVVCIDPMTMPEVPAGKQFQLWAIVGGKPVSAGVFETGKNADIQMLQVVPQAEAFAVTLEKTGGVTVPEGEMYVMAKI